MASVVTIKVTVDDANATSTLNKIEESLNNVGVQGSSSIRQLGQGVDELGGHLARPLDAVRLLSQEFGFRLPRALESIIARSPQVASALQNMIGVLAGTAGAEVLERMGEEAYKLYERFISIQEPVDKFRESLQKAAEIDFTNVRSLETLVYRLDIAQTNAMLAPGAARQMQHRGLADLIGAGMNPTALGGALGEIYGARQTAESGATSMQQSQDLSVRQVEMEHQRTLDAIKRAHAADDELGAAQKILAEKQKTHEIDAENAAFTRKMEGTLGNPVAGDSGEEERRNKDAEADTEANVKLHQLRLEQQLAIMKAQNEAREAGLQGEALYAAKRKDAIAALRAELAVQHELEELPARREALEEQFDNERLKRTRELNEETYRAHDEAASAGLNGSARIIAEGRAAQNRIDTAENNRRGKGGSLTEEEELDFDQQRIDADASMHQKLKELEDNFTEHAKALAQERMDAQLGEFGRVDAEATRTLEALKKSYEADIAANQESDEKKQAATKAYNDAVLAINADAEQKKKDLRERNAEQDAEYDRQAAQAEARVRGNGLTGWIGQHRAAIDAIEAQEAERMKRIQEDEDKRSITHAEAEKRRLDVTKETEAAIQEQQQQAAHTLAGTLESVWDNPMKALKEKAQHAMFEIIADWMMQTQMFKSFFGGALGTMQPGASTGAAAGGAPSVLQPGAAAGVPGIGGIIGRALGFPIGVRAPGTGGVINGGTTLPAGYNDGPGTRPVLHRRDTSAPDAGDIPDGGGDFTGGDAGGGDLLNVLRGTPAPGGTSGGASIPGVGGGSSTAMSSIAGIGSLAGVGLAGYAGAEGVLDSFHQKGVGGAVHGVESGAGLGASIGSIVPGLGTAAGAILGAAAGLATNIVGDVLGISGRFAARDYYKQSIEPQLDALKNHPGGSDGDYMQQMDEVNTISSQGMTTMAVKFGQSAAEWVNQNYMQKEVLLIDGTIAMHAQGGSAYTGMAAKQFHGGGLIDGFGDFATSSTEGLIHAMRGEGVVTEPAMAEHGAGVGMMNRGASAADMASHYLAMSGGSSRGVPAGGGGGHTFNIHTLDPKTMQHWMRNGGAKMILGGLNDHAANYSGDGSM